MFLKTLRKVRHTLALRLTFWYAGIFAISSIMAFLLIYLWMVAAVLEQTDDDLEEDIEEFVGFMQEGGLERVKTEIIREAQGEEADSSFYRLWTADGQELLASDLSSWSDLSAPTAALAELEDADEPIFETLSLAQHEHNIRSIYALLGTDVVLQIGESLEEGEVFLSALLSRFLIMLIAVVLFGGLIGWFMARRALRGVQEITRTAIEIADGELDRRVAVRSQHDELATLAQTFNMMLDRIQALIIGMREMTDNLAHDLRSPLGRMRASAEMTLSSGAAKSESETMAITTTEECDRLLEMINTTLDIAEAESGAAKLKLSDIDLVELVRDALELFESVAEDKQVTITAELPDHCHIRGDRQRLQRVVANLLDNALKYIPLNGRVTIGLSNENQQIKLSVTDNGIGMSADETARIFERFYRCDRSRTEHGNGLGLSLALAFVRAHGGNILVNSSLQQGSTFNVVLPHSAELYHR